MPDADGSLSAAEPHPPRPVVSLGTFCMTSAMIEWAGISQPSYPFDDMFSSIAVVLQCLEDDFAVFLDDSAYLPLGDATGWVQRHYRDEFGTRQTFAHHDMRLEKNRASFRRKVDRFRAIRGEDDPLFVIIDYSDRIPIGDEFDRLRRQLDRRFGDCILLVISLGASEPLVPGWNRPGIVFRHRTPRQDSRIEGTAFTDAADNHAIIGFIHEALVLKTRA
jgi:hypothetical protein